MICKICGKEVSDDATYCDGCGSPLENPGRLSVQPPKTDRSQAEQPQAEQSQTEQLQAEQPQAEQSQTEQSQTEQLRVDQTQTDRPQTELTQIERPSEETPRCDAEPSAESEGRAAQAPPKPKIKSHMALSIVLAVIFNSWMLGIPAIVFARECELAAEKEQWELARRFSGKALAFSLIGVAFNLALGTFLALVIVVLAAAGPSIFMW